MEPLQNGLHNRAGVTPLLSMREVLLVWSQRWGCIDTDAQCKRSLIQGIDVDADV